MSNILISEDIHQLSKNFADWLVVYAEKIIKEKEIFTIALSGGSTPKILHELLASEPYKSKIEWEKWHFFMGDERFVPFSDERSNAKMAYETLLNHVPVNADQIHFYQTENITPEESAIAYEEVLRSFFGNSEVGLDLIILGMGDDGHTLSLFPHQQIVFEDEKWVDSFWLESQDMFRITMTKVVANHANRVAFLVAGENKQHALHEVLQGKENPSEYPSQVIKPHPGEVFWFLDKKAAEGIV